MTINNDTPQISKSTGKLVTIIIVAIIIAGVFYSIPSKKEVKLAQERCGMSENFGKKAEYRIDCTQFSNYSKYLK